MLTNQIINILLAEIFIENTNLVKNLADKLPLKNRKCKTVPNVKDAFLAQTKKIIKS